VITPFSLYSYLNDPTGTRRSYWGQEHLNARKQNYVNMNKFRGPDTVQDEVTASMRSNDTVAIAQYVDRQTKFSNRLPFNDLRHAEQN